MNAVCRLVLLAVVLMPCALPAQTPLSAATPPESTAQLIKVSGELARLKELAGKTDGVDRWEVLWLHQHITEQVISASLQVDATLAQIDNEIARANEVRGYLADRRDRTVSRTNLLGVLLGGSVGATSSALQLSSSLTKPAAAVGIGAGVLSAGLALEGIHQQAGKTSPFAFQSNMLAEFFDRPTLPNSRYPETVWIFLNESSATGPVGVTRKEDLLRAWVQVQRIDSLSSTQKIDRLTSEPSSGLRLTIDDFEDRSAMLQDVRARISYLKRDLGTLLASLPAVAH
jgi:hypothetical protein